ncbi:hypothetical protein D3C72_2316710 [compost metagenome]
MPAQMRGTGLPSPPIAQQEQGGARFGGPETQSPAGREIERLGHRADIGQDARDRAAAQRLLGRPEQFGHIGRPHDHQPGRVEAEADQARPIGQPGELPVLGQI